MGMTIEEVRQYALQNYNKGGDVVYECWEDYEIQNFLKETTAGNQKTALDNIFKFNVNEEEEVQITIY